MALSYKTKRRLALLWLVVGIPIYIIAAVYIVSLFERPSILIELLVYLVLGVAWAFLLKPLFVGVGQADPDVPPTDEG